VGLVVEVKEANKKIVGIQELLKLAKLELKTEGGLILEKLKDALAEPGRLLLAIYICTLYTLNLE
jgi:hypothetical protein